jgi:hypothetical protein
MQFDKARLVLVTRVFVMAASLCIWTGAATWAIPINHGDFVADDVVFRGVSEDSPNDPAALPLFGSPTVGGNSLDFNKISFGALSEAGGFDLTEGNLTMGIEALGGASIDEISLSEAGDYSLFNLGGPLAIASVSAVVYLDILEVDGVGIDPVKLQAKLIFSPSGGVFELSTNDWIPSTIWNGELTIDVTEALQNESIPGRATKVSLTLTDLLAAASGPQTASLINKSDLAIAVHVIPEPATLALLGAGLLGLFLMGERRRAGRRQGPSGPGS